MALIAGYGGVLAFGGQSAVVCKSFTLNMERDSLDVTTISDYRTKRAPGRVRRSGTMTLFRSTGDALLMAHMFPTSAATAATATLALTYTDQGTVVYGAFDIQVTSASISDDGSGPATWELTWEEQ